MRILDKYVRGGTAYIKVQIRYGEEIWELEYGFTGDLSAVTFEHVKEVIAKKAQELIADKKLTDTIFDDLEDRMNQEVYLD